MEATGSFWERILLRSFYLGHSAHPPEWVVGGSKIPAQEHVSLVFLRPTCWSQMLTNGSKFALRRSLSRLTRASSSPACSVCHDHGLTSHQSLARVGFNVDMVAPVALVRCWDHFLSTQQWMASKFTLRTHDCVHQTMPDASLCLTFQWLS